MARQQQQQQRRLQQSLPLPRLLLLAALAVLGRVAQGFHLPSTPTAAALQRGRQPQQQLKQGRLQMVLDPASVLEGVSRCVGRWDRMWLFVDACCVSRPATAVEGRRSSAT